MTNNKTGFSLSTAALIAGFTLLIMVIMAPFVELFAYPKLVKMADAEETIKNITVQKGLFVYIIFGYLITFICDVVVAWALYILFKPVNEPLSLLAGIFRWIYSIIALMALLNLVTVFRILHTIDYATILQANQLNSQIMYLLKSFKSSWYFGLIFFGIHLALLGYLVIKSGYVPTILGVLLIITGIGYLLTVLRPYLYPDFNVDFANYTFYGELIFMLWLLIRGRRIKGYV